MVAGDGGEPEAAGHSQVDGQWCNKWRIAGNSSGSAPSATQTVGLRGSKPAPSSASVQPGSARSHATAAQKPQRSGNCTLSRLRRAGDAAEDGSARHTSQHHSRQREVCCCAQEIARHPSKRHARWQAQICSSAAPPSRQLSCGNRKGSTKPRRVTWCGVRGRSRQTWGSAGSAGRPPPRPPPAT